MALARILWMIRLAQLLPEELADLLARQATILVQIDLIEHIHRIRAILDLQAFNVEH